MQVEFYFDYVSPYSYLASTQLLRLEQWGAEILFKPVLLGGIQKILGSVPPIQQPGATRASYMVQDLERWAELYGVPFKLSAAFPMNTLLPLRATPWLQAQGCFRSFFHLCFDAAWGEGLDIGQEEVLRGIVTRLGLDPEAFFQAARSAENKQWLKEATEQSIERGIFGVPTLFVGDEMYFGNDRLLFVNQKLAALVHEEEQRRLRG
ncbi:MAG: 2-hydroxychromene-2-carboxylate isomerase [Myxococcota bacterium]